MGPTGHERSDEGKTDESNTSFQVVEWSDEGLPLAEAQPSFRPGAGAVSAEEGRAVSGKEERLSPSELRETSRAPLAARISGEGRRAEGGTGNGTAE